MQIGLGIQRRLGGSGGLVMPNSDELVSYTKPLLDSRGSSSRTIFKPQSGLFNGTSDKVPLPEAVTLVGNFEVEISFKYVQTGPWQAVLSHNSATTVLIYLTMFPDGVRCYIGGASIPITGLVLTENTLYTGSLSRTGTVLSLELNGNTYTESCGTDDVLISRIGDENGGDYFKGNLYSVKASDSTGLKFHYEHPTIVGSDAIWFDLSGNELHATASVADINAHVHEDDTLTFGSDWLNQMGWSDGTGGYAGVSIPADTTGLLDILDNPLDYPGRAKYNLELVNNTATLQDGIDTIAFTELVGTETVVSSVGTSTPTISAGQIDFTAGTCSMIVLDNGWTIPLEEGSGTTAYAYSGSNNYTGTITASDIGAFWSGEKDGENHNYLYGYELSGSVKVPANPNTGLSVLGNALTVPPRRLTDQIWQHPECMDIRAIDIDCGNDYFYDSASSYAAFARSLTEWQALDGSDQVFQGPKGVVIYDTDQDADAQVKINKVLGVS